MEQQLALAVGIDVTAREHVGRYVHRVEPHLAVLDARVGLADGGVPVAERLDLGTLEHDAALPGVEDAVVVARGRRFVATS